MKLQKENIPFTQVANVVLNDPNISFKAKGMFAYLFSKPDDWNFESNRISKDSSDGRDSTRSALNELEKAGYLIRIKLPNRRMEYVLRYSKKANDGKAVIDNDGNSHSGETRLLSNKDKESNKDKDIAAVAARAEIQKRNVVKTNNMTIDYNFDNYLKSMEDNPSRHIQVIAFYFKKKKLRFKTLQEVQSAIRRHLRAAREVANFDDDAIVNAYKKADREYPNLYTVETLLKVLTR